MANLDEKIYQALSEEDAALFKAQMSELGIFDALGETFKGKHRFINMFGFILTFVIFGLVVYFGIAFFTTADIAQKLNWMGAFLTAVIAITAMKLWFWMEMNRVTILRDIKRMELQTALALRGSEK